MTTNASLDPRVDFSEWLHGELIDTYIGETEVWATERVARVMRRLNAERRDGTPIVAEILWVPECTAFTLSGQYIYITRPLLGRLPSDDAVAFVLAHEIAHHDCGHLDLFAGWADWVPRSRSTGYVAAIMRLLEHKTYSPGREDEADKYAVELCLDAGFDGELALYTFEILEQRSLDYGDLDGVFGPENLLDPTDVNEDSASYRMQRWLSAQTRGYLPLRERNQRARAWLRASLARRATSRSSARP